MRIFSYLYDKMISWAKHHRAPYYLTGVSFAESSFFPIPPDVMLVPMALAKPEQAWRYASLATIGSVFGAVFGYFLGALFIASIRPLLQSLGYYDTYLLVQNWFLHWGTWLILIAGFTPVPYKLFTLAAGALRMPVLPFILLSIIGRGARFYLVSTLLYFCGEKVEKVLRKYIDLLGWSFVLFFVVVLYLYCR